MNELRVIYMDPTDSRAKFALEGELREGWTIGGMFKPSIFRRRIVVYLQRAIAAQK